jgi:hypothetical protein
MDVDDAADREALGPAAGKPVTRIQLRKKLQVDFFFVTFLRSLRNQAQEKVAWHSSQKRPKYIVAGFAENVLNSVRLFSQPF